jgi:ABC-2 type transport system permease protein/oleandomycin transport system permease protein
MSSPDLVRSDIHPAERRASALQNVRWTLSDVVVMTQRYLMKYIRLPQLLVFSTIQPVMFVLLFTFVFGGAIQLSGASGDLSYIDYLLPGVLVQTVLFGATNTGVGLAEDLAQGLVDRFRSLPMARFAVLAGRTIADTVRNIFVVLLMTGVGFLIGFRFSNGVLPFVAGLLLTVLFGLAFSWISATIGLTVRDSETAQIATTVWIFPLIFISSAFVPTEGMPSWLQTFAHVNPITHTVNAVRALMQGNQVLQDGTLWTPLLWSLGWIVVLFAIFFPLAVHRYRRSV